MSSNSESYFPVYHRSVPVSVKNQTKDKLQELFNAAMHKRKNQRKERSISKENLLCDPKSTSTSSENLAGNNKKNDIELEELKEQSKQHTLSKFIDAHTKHHENNLDDTNTEDSVFVKPPIPKPRKMKQISPTVSQGTFEVTSPKIIQNLEKDDASSSSNKTYKIETVGDIIVHKSPPSKMIVMKNSREDETNHCEILSEQSTFIKQPKISENADNVEELTNSDTKDLSINNNMTTKTVSKIKHATIISDSSSEPKTMFDYKKIIEIIIHRTDRLQLDTLVIHPVVKIHIIDITLGKYLLKSDKTRPVVFFYENNNTDWISPVMTHTFNLQEKRLLYPSWEEKILLNEDFEYFKQKSPDIMLFFEVLDFVSAAMLNRSNGKDTAKGWHNIAFAFLKLSAKNGLMNADRKVRLQLYHAHQSKGNDPQVCYPWIWFKNKKLKKYPSTLYVTVRSTISPTEVVETFRSKTPVQKESSSKTKLWIDSHCDQIPLTGNVVQTSDVSSDTDSKIKATWSRKPKEKCKLPNKCLSKFDTYDRGCFVMKFSHNGLYLACGVQIEKLFHVIIYEISSFRKMHTIPSHHGLIYSIKWSSDDSFLLSASADNTVSIYNLTSRSIFQVLPHPSFVYCCDITSEKFIVTGCYDGTLRIWNCSTRKHDRKIEYYLFQELCGHNGYVTCVCYNTNLNVFSADSNGVIIEWQKQNEDWILGRKINILDLKETVINQIILFLKGKRMTVHSRDSTIRIIDVKSGCVLQWLKGATNRRFQISGCISPCGTYVFSGSENGVVHIWNSRNGSEVATLTPFSSDHGVVTIHCVEFHPHENIISISHYGKNIPVLLYHFDDSIEQSSVDKTLQEIHGQELIQGKANYFQTKLEKMIKETNSTESCDKLLNFKSILDKIDSVIKK